MAEGLPHLMFYYQDNEVAEAGDMKMAAHCMKGRCYSMRTLPVIVNWKY